VRLSVAGKGEAVRLLMAKCDCCKGQFQQVDADRLCFGCSLVQDFARGIEETTDLAGDDAINLACEFVELVRSRILKQGRDAPKEAWAGFFEDVGRGMTRVDH
jgi:hypothetical protein